MKWLRRLVVLLPLLTAPAWFAIPAFAVQPDEVLKNPILEARARALSKQLRCMVCQNESIDESNAPLAHDLRVLVRDRLKQGDSDRQVLDFLVARYGEFVLLRPRLHWRTAILWFGPPGLLLGGAIVLLLIARRRRRAQSSAPEAIPLTPAEQARITQLMKSESSQRP
jgi:cytochrome c-type biogenesis protein CcmH